MTDVMFKLLKIVRLFMKVCLELTDNPTRMQNDGCHESCHLHTWERNIIIPKSFYAQFHVLIFNLLFFET